MNRLSSVLLAIGLCLAFVAVAAAQNKAMVTVVHGIPNTDVDVYVNGQVTLKSFKFGTVTDPLSLDPGSYKIEIRPAGAAATSAPILSTTANLQAGQNVSLVAHLTADGKPALDAYVNDTSMLAAGKARLTVRHDAAAPAVDILANNAKLVGNLANPKEAKADVDAGTYAVAIAPAGQTTPVFGPQNLTLNAGTGYVVYAVGSLSDKTFTLLVQQIPGLGGGPMGAATGEGGLAQRPAFPASGWLFIGLAVAALAASAAMVVRTRARVH